MEGTKETNACTFEGTVKSFDTAKGYGFITQSDLSVNRDVNQGQGEGLRNLVAGDRVRYEVTQGAIAPQATNVRKL
ncbi:MAG: cold shock domain-containing protein [candidate division Zixibacteria bacterium]|nr:cold shock domain-containing protein [candidate division Zixibacteria bacterium]